ncbi:MAG: undecaprenyl/decaprenyl-phosphate alpha-N-acetylglucosaminyl 1-phosphate transferase [Erysipelotrichaceae bacterium]|nr:undecaprenyl/decaprenyl-phosphate alpha-N-acetylglucosaminyl 1-phosphate transferase [Erysipelotrichaceae bacterium]
MDWLKYLLIPFLISTLITPILKKIAYRLNIYAEMNERTIHTKKIARIGGVAIYVAFIVSMAMFVKVDDAFNRILIGATIMFVGGLVDDMLNLKPMIKLAFQIIAALVLTLFGGITLDAIRMPLGISINLGIISFLVTFVWVIGITNAVNLIDGLDGLAGGISVIILTVIATLSVLEGRNDIMMLSLILAGSTLGFLIYNSHPASIFMGDCGALFLGFVISAISLLGFKSSTLITLGLPILLLGIPILDTISAIIRRKLSGKSFSDADKNHLHHVLMRRFGHRNTVLILYAITGLFGVTAYTYIVNKALGFVVLSIMVICIELFLEISHMISPQYHPILSVVDGIRKMMKKPSLEEEIEEKLDEKLPRQDI